jgi:uncharacterized membrane protein YkvA (DUF1232 family)
MARRGSRAGRLVRALNMLAFLPLAGRAPLYGRLLWSLALDPRVPPARKALLVGAALYVISPVELIPDELPVIGALDDVAVVILAIDAFLDGLPEGLLGEKTLALGIERAELEADLARVRRLVPKPVRHLFARLPDAIEGLAEFVGRSGLERRLEEMADRYLGHSDEFADYEEEGLPA